ncbi:Hok/Gef family protein [Salmonella enterica]|uniref:Hok/Gef family protein n=1 Tax=Salmonella enterica subsp. salamae TaxID=59202 RepID=A0A5Y2LWF1_SALER|nr:Hok/Gef family protein [Salmonella enterica]EBS3173885.1 hok/gef family protein [Salmonella enterica subsp. enterica serovar Newport]ECC1608308.1 Hok/Gef family protein [Salmonella enterica subsp. salamae]EDV4558933.1 Hok/Gef family protein [Salmonella enterica subsp. enterica]EEE9161659.1 Hok/Gef family protein [Salmonella enterica subsp. enterica serovar Kimberley]HAE4725528.1 Hok/Gef family protein [Salmonella enterica subsp. salamae serovar 47:a:1,5]
MSQKSLSTITICIVVVLVVWILHGSLCELHVRLGDVEFAAFLQCRQ